MAWFGVLCSSSTIPWHDSVSAPCPAHLTLLLLQPDKGQCTPLVYLTSLQTVLQALRSEAGTALLLWPSCENDAPTWSLDFGATALAWPFCVCLSRYRMKGILGPLSPWLVSFKSLSDLINRVLIARWNLFNVVCSFHIIWLVTIACWLFRGPAQPHRSMLHSFAISTRTASSSCDSRAAVDSGPYWSKHQGAQTHQDGLHGVFEQHSI